jgi:hypothetical protein
VGPAVFTRIDHLTGPLGTERASAGGSATLIEIDDAGPRFSVLTAEDPDAGRLAYLVTAAEIEHDLDTFGLR